MDAFYRLSSDQGLDPPRCGTAENDVPKPAPVVLKRFREHTEMSVPHVSLRNAFMLSP
jgi:hypothetical protein